MFGLSPQELLVVLLIILLLFGGKKIPELARALGKAVREFKKGLQDVSEDIDKAGTPADTRPTSAPEKPETRSGNGDQGR